MPDWYQKRRRDVEKLFTLILDDKRFATNEGFTSSSPSGEFQLSVSVYETSDTRPSWRFSRGLVSRVLDEKILADIKRDFGHFPFAWVQQRGKDYLICGEHYQGYSIVNLTKEETNVYVPDIEKDDLFCWAEIKPSPSGMYLMVYGCYWASDYELRLYDFSNPSEPPFPQAAALNYLYGDPYNDSETSFMFKDWKWIDDEHVELTVEFPEKGGQKEESVKTWLLPQVFEKLRNRSQSFEQ